MTKEKSLTIKQENFCQAYIKTSNASESYRQSYSVGKMKETTINRCAHDVLKNHNVATRINELREELKQESKIDTQAKREALWTFVQRAIKGESAESSGVQALRELNLMDGDHAPKEQTITNKDGDQEYNWMSLIQQKRVLDLVVTESMDIKVAIDKVKAESQTAH